VAVGITSGNMFDEFRVPFAITCGVDFDDLPVTFAITFGVDLGNSLVNVVPSLWGRFG